MLWMVPIPCQFAFADGNAYEATVKGFDESEDLAVVSVATKDVSDDTMDAISCCNDRKASDDLKIGEQVVAIGNALGLWPVRYLLVLFSAKTRMTDASGQIEGDPTDNCSSSQSKGEVNLIPDRCGLSIPVTVARARRIWMVRLLVLTLPRLLLLRLKVWGICHCNF